MDNGNFISFNVNSKCLIDILQSADDTLLVGNGSWKHVWVVNSIMSGFELVS